MRSGHAMVPLKISLAVRIITTLVGVRASPSPSKRTDALETPAA